MFSLTHSTFPPSLDYFSFRTSIFLGSEQSATTFYSLYQSCSTTTLYSDSVQAAAREMCAAVYFAEIFMVLAFISQCFASFLYLVTDSATLVSENGFWAEWLDGDSSPSIDSITPPSFPPPFLR